MKKLYFLSVVVLVIIVIAMLISCSPKTTYVEVEFPSLDEQIGYEITFSRMFSTAMNDDRIYSFKAGEDVYFEVLSDEAYTLEEMVVKANGEVVVGRDYGISYNG